MVRGASYFDDPFLRNFIGMNGVFLSNSDLFLHNLSCMAEGTEENLGPCRGLLLLRRLVLLLLGCRSCAESCRSSVAL